MKGDNNNNNNMIIKEIVTTKYLVDGKEFDTYEQAYEYKEQFENGPIVKMYDECGEITNARYAIFVFLKGTGAAKQFIKQALKDESVYNGIEEGDNGFFYWDWHESRYHKIEQNKLETMYNTYFNFVDCLNQ